MMDKYYLQGEIKKLEIELWNLKVKGNDVPIYTERFQELTLICTKFAANEIKKVDKYISGLSDNIYGNVKSSKPKMLDETIELANDLMDQKLRTIGKANWQQKEADDPSKLTMAINKQPSRDRSRQGATIMYGVRRKEAYGGSLLKCTKCAFSINNGSCTQKSQKYKKRANRAVPKREWFVLNVEAPRTLSKDCPKLKNKDGNGNRHKAGYTQLEMQRTECFISTAFSSLIDIVPTPLENSYDVELTDGKIVGAQEYMARGCQIFLAQIIRQKEDDQSEGKQLKDGTRSFGFFEVVSRGLACLPPARPLNSRSDLIPGSAPVMLLRCHGHQSCNCLTKFLSLEALFEGRHIKRGRDTKIPQSSAPPNKGSGPRCQDTKLGVVDAQTRFEIPSKQSIDPPLSRGYTLGSGEDINPIIYTSCIEQFWATAKSSIREDLHLDDAEGTDCLPTATIFEELARMGYEKPSQKLTFYKAFFSPQWKYFIHTITQCLSAKSTTWNEFSSSMASLIICLATNQKFNLSKYIFDAMVKHLDGGVKFLMYPCFLQVFINQQLSNMSTHKKIFVNPFHTKKVFAKKKRAGERIISERIYTIYDTMMVQVSEEVGEDSDHPTDSTQIPIIDQPSSSSQPKKKQPSKKAQRQEAEVPQDETEHEESVPTPFNDLQPSGDDSMQLTDLMVLCTKLQTQVLDLEKATDAQAKEITALKKGIQRLERKKMSRPTGLKRLKKVGMSRRVESSEDQDSLGAPEDASKQGRSIADLDEDYDVTLVDETQERQDDELMFDTGVLDADEMPVEAKVDEKDEQSTNR
ncbi:hypothetical protein Tco_1105517 [Tanacetum coccineum]